MNRPWAYWPSRIAAAFLLAVCGTLFGSLNYQFIAVTIALATFHQLRIAA
ncbi:MAG: hypothetical protein ACREKL_14675 [Chthoniobacterales bacterium]